VTLNEKPRDIKLKKENVVRHSILMGSH